MAVCPPHLCEGVVIVSLYEMPDTLVFEHHCLLGHQQKHGCQNVRGCLFAKQKMGIEFVMVLVLASSNKGDSTSQ